MDNKDNESKVKSLVKAMRVLECFSVEQPELGVSQLAQMTGLYKSTVHNILSTFRDMGYILFNAQTSKYSLGLGLLHFSYVINTQMEIGKVFLPFLHEIANETGELCYFGVPDGKDVLYIESASPNGTSVRYIRGEKAPLYCTGIGKAMLAFLPNPQEHIPDKMTSFTEHTLVNKDLLLQDLEEIRRRGFSIDNMEHEFGVKCVAVPVFDHTKRLIAAISVSAPSLRIADDDMPKIADKIEKIIAPVQGRL